MKRTRIGMAERPTMAETSKSQLLWIVTLAIVVGAPLFIVPGAQDIFRTPKELYFLAGTILLLAAAAVSYLTRRLSRPWFSIKDPAVILSLSTLVWTVVATLFSSNRLLSVPSTLLVAAFVIFLLSVLYLAPSLSIAAVIATLVPAAINALLLTLQEADLWRPVPVREFLHDPHLASTGLMGNPNDVGALLAGPALAGIALSLLSRGRLRFIASTLTLLIVVGLIASQTLTAVLSFVAGLFLLLPFLFPRHARRVILILLFLTVVLFSLVPPASKRVIKLAELASQGNYNLLTTNRLTPFIAAAEMARRHPLTGVGPGAFGWNYLVYRPLAETRLPSLRRPAMVSGWNFNFGEVHNDHLEILAETGLPGYVLYLTALVILAGASFRQTTNGQQDVRIQFARALALPLAVCFFVLTLAQFPLQLTAPTVTYLYLSALVYGWAKLGVGPMELSSVQEPSRLAPESSATRSGARASRSALIVACSLVGFAALFLTYRVSFIPFLCNIRERVLQERTRRTNTRADTFAAAPSARENLEQLDKLQRNCASANLYMIQAANLRVLDRKQEAIAAYENALRYDRRPEIYFQLALTQAELGMHQEAERNFIIACDFQPSLLGEVPSHLRKNVAAAIEKRSETLRRLTKRL